MAARPDIYADWAENDITEVRVINEVPQSLPNKQETTNEFKLSGLLYRQNLPREFFNYILNHINKWIKHLDQRYSVGDIHLTLTTEDATAISTRLGGTWVQRGTQSTGTVVSKVWEKTA